jgi:hypothetical protein
VGEPGAVDTAGWKAVVVAPSDWGWCVVAPLGGGVWCLIRA